MQLDEETKKKVLAEHPEALTVTVPETAYESEFVCMVRPPQRGAWKRFRAMSNDESQRAEALEMLAKECILHPPLAEFTKLLETRPGLADTVGGELTEIGGLVKGASTKK